MHMYVLFVAFNSTITAIDSHMVALNAPIGIFGEDNTRTRSRTIIIVTSLRYFDNYGSFDSAQYHFNLIQHGRGCNIDTYTRVQMFHSI